MTTSVIVGGGIIQEYYTLNTKCINGKKGYAKVRARATAVGFGLPYSGNGGSVTFYDNLNEVNPNVFNGQYKKSAYGVGAGMTTGGGLTELGGAST